MKEGLRRSYGINYTVYNIYQRRRLVQNMRQQLHILDDTESNLHIIVPIEAFIVCYSINYKGYSIYVRLSLRGILTKKNMRQQLHILDYTE